MHFQTTARLSYLAASLLTVLLVTAII